MKRRNSQSGNAQGNALWFILIAVALLGALTIQLSRSGSSVEKTGSKEQTIIEASKVLRYAASMDQAVKNLQLKGCSENEISFENTTDTNYTNATSPTNKSCHIFDVDGEGMSWRVIDADETLNTGASLAFVGDIALYGQNYGTDDTQPDLILAIPVSAEVCLDINDTYNISAVTADITSDISTWDEYFVGSFPSAGTWEFGDSASEAQGVAGENSGCIIDNNGQHVFYHVLIVR